MTPDTTWVLRDSVEVTSRKFEEGKTEKMPLESFVPQKVHSEYSSDPNSVSIPPVSTSSICDSTENMQESQNTPESMVPAISGDNEACDEWAERVDATLFWLVGGVQQLFENKFHNHFDSS